MSKTKEKEEQKKHIDIKDKGDDVSKIIGDMIQETIQKLTNLSYDKMLTNLNIDKSKWYAKQNATLGDFKTKLNNVATKEKKRLNRAILGAQDVLNLTPNQVTNIKKIISSNVPKIVNSVYKTHVKNIADVKTITYKSNVTNDLYNTIKNKIENTQNYGIVEYKNGRKVRWENYLEMKVRTDIQNDIGENMVQNGASNGVVFYLSAYFGDCAIDHADYQGKIYYDANYESIAPKDMLDEIKAYIDSNKLISVQEIKDGPVYLTTRPNCRHYFQYISIDEVLAIKNNNELNKKREDLGLNFNGKYKPEKYKALSKQRANERAIRKWKGKLEADNKILEKIPSSASSEERLKIQSTISTDKRKIKYWQSQQRDLIRKNSDTLERNYDREAYGKMVSDFNIKKEYEDRINIYKERYHLTFASMNDANDFMKKNLIKLKGNPSLEEKTLKINQIMNLRDKLHPIQTDKILKDYLKIDDLKIVPIDSTEKREGTAVHIINDGHSDMYTDKSLLNVITSDLDYQEIIFLANTKNDRDGKRVIYGIKISSDNCVVIIGDLKEKNIEMVTSYKINNNKMKNKIKKMKEKELNPCIIINKEL